jgi:hypothetical protein
MIVVDLVIENPKNKFAPYARMANAIIAVTKEKGGCLPQDLLEKGFSKEETVERWHMANAMASVDLKLESVS